VASPADADDVLQEVFVRIHRGLATLADAERFGPWVYRVAAHAVSDHLRARARHPSALADGVLELAHQEEVDDEQPALEGALAECVALFVARLPSPYREAITLTELEGLTQRSAAEMLGISLSGVKSRVQRGRERIRAMFSECCEISLDARGHVRECSPRSLEPVPEDCRSSARSWAARRP